MGDVERKRGAGTISVRVVVAVGAVIAIAGAVGLWLALHEPLRDEILTHYDEATRYEGLSIVEPFDGAVFPPEIAAPAFRWNDGNLRSDLWLVTFKFGTGRRLCFRSDRAEWTPDDGAWDEIKRRTLESDARVTVLGVDRAEPTAILSGSSISIRTSKDEVGAPIFYREVLPPFKDAALRPQDIVWRFGDITARERPPVVLDRLPVCANCHTVSFDGKTLGMDIDRGNDKGSYIVAPIGEQMTFKPEMVISWSDYRREDGERTFGLLSSVSPDGRYVVSTVKDRVVSVSLDDVAFSLEFFPVKGILAVYDRARKTYTPLLGADDRDHVQSNPTWSPDGKTIVFTRAKVHPIARVPRQDDIILTPEQAGRFLDPRVPYQYDLYRVPFNGGKGGKAEPVDGAAQNGSSNYFPKFSPDGKWIVFCKARRFMLLQADSELWIVPAGGGTARRLRCNTARMNSWHSWSPNSRWLVFSSKVHSTYTQLFLTHIDERGESSPAVVLARFTAPDRAANIPEFVNARPGAMGHIDADALREHYDSRGLPGE